MFDIQMDATAQALVACGKGILAADESTGTIEKRFKNVGAICLRRTVPAAMPGLVFLSGGQSDVRSTEHLNAMNQANAAPWELSFSFGRALQAPALKAWAGQSGNIAAAQRALLHRARCNGAARTGKYSQAMEAA